MTDWEPPRAMEHRGRSLGFALELRDRFTGEEPGGGVAVEVAPDEVSPTTNPSGYYLFLDLDVDEVEVTVDGGDRYVDQRRRVVVDGGEAGGGEAGGGGATGPGGRESADAGDPPVEVVTDPAEPVVVALSPTPAYQFPETTTLVRGHVEDGDGEPVAGATVTLREFDPVVQTTAAGEFALWVPATAEHVLRRDGRNVVVVDAITGSGRRAADGGGGTDPTLVVSHPDHDEHTERIEVAAGERTVRYVTLQ